MSEMARLIQNEMIKLIHKRRFFVILSILVVLISLFVYAQMRQAESMERRFGNVDWQTSLQQQIIESENRLNSPRFSEERRNLLKINIEQQRFYLEKNINPSEPGGSEFTRQFLELSITLFFPLLIMIGAIDLVSGEHREGTIKLLLTRPVQRWKVLLSKLIALNLFISMIITMMIVLSYMISGAIFGYHGWGTPTLIGFQVQGDVLITSNVKLIPLWQYTWIAAGLTWFVGFIIGCITLLVSVLVRSSAAGMGVMLAAIISGPVLSGMASEWEGAKYLFMINTNLTQYLSIGSPPIASMTLPFSITVLLIWGLAALITAFFTFQRQDMLA